jgi:hypothetical protein
MDRKMAWLMLAWYRIGMIAAIKRMEMKAYGYL